MAGKSVRGDQFLSPKMVPPDRFWPRTEIFVTDLVGGFGEWGDNSFSTLSGSCTVLEVVEVAQVAL